MALDPGICHSALVVEDDPAIRRLVEKLLQRSGIAIHSGNTSSPPMSRMVVTPLAR